ncbi:eCIS core domain-containing protein [Streptomyces sp. SudanB182_2057]|uniref:eCIS core domain-containing protein n=1 Tax=Streptomyces sp. SudanB182_2057 TaxID=3035281 RepID=UPI003F576224
MRYITEPGRNTGTDREQARPGKPVQGSGARAAALQRAVGNAAVARMIERERDREGTHRAAVQASGGGEAIRDEAVREAAKTAGRGGSRLPDGVRATMENAFGTKLDHIRVSVDEQAAAGIGATAYTVGDNIVVQSAGVLRDVETMAHEIHHTTQHDAPTGLSDPGNRWEREASDVGARVARGESVHHRAADGEEVPDGTVHRTAVQRRVGFEFESQWRVRDHNGLTPEDERKYQNEVSERDAAIGVQVLVRMADLRQNSALLDETERSSTSERLKEKWLTGKPGNYQATDEGRARLERARRESPAVYAQHMDFATLPLLQNGLIRETPIPGRDVPKMGTVGRGTGYRLTSDVSPTGGSALEWVTDPLTTKDELLRVMNEITQVSSALDARKDRDSFPLQEVDLGGFEAVPGMMVYPLNGVLVYAPQMTAGFKLDELPRLVKYLEVPDKRPLLTLPGAFEQRKEAKQDLHQVSLRMVDRIRRNAKAQAKDLPKEVTGGGPTDGLVGLVTLTGSYLKYGEDLGDRANSKSIAGGLMSRTSFAHNFTLLPPPMVLYYSEHPAEFAAFVLRAADLDPADEQALVYPRSVEHGDAGHRAKRQIPLTRHRWLMGIPAGKDLLRNYKHLDDEEKTEVEGNAEDWKHIHRSLGALGSVDDRVGRPGKEKGALVAELRRMKDGLRTAELTPLTLAAFDLVERLNEGRSLTYKKKSR